METTETGLVRILDNFFFVLGGLASVYLAYLTLREGITPGWQMLLVIVFWVLVAYLVLPRLHRILSRVYVPDYFIGRTRTADGLLGDPVNLALMGSVDQVHEAMRQAGWTRADELTVATGWRIVTSTLARRSYPAAPVSPLLLFRRRQDFAYQQEVHGNPAQRHHVRFWKCPDGWRLPGGLAVDWLAAGTFDRSVGLSLFTLQITHKIGADVDAERDHIVTTVLAGSPQASVRVRPDFFTGYHSRNGGGDLIETDGDLPVIDLRAVPAETGASGPMLDPDRISRPVQTVFGSLITLLQGAVYLFLVGVVAILPVTEAAPDEGVVRWVVGGVLAGIAVINVTLGIALFRGRNWARLALCAFSTVGVASVIAQRLLGGINQPLFEELLPLATGVLVLLALSSDAAREYALRKRRSVSVGRGAPAVGVGD